MESQPEIEQSDWYKYYEKIRDPSWLDIMATISYQYKYFKQILCKKPQSALEVGTGRGVHAIILSYFIPKVFAIDRQSRLLEKAKKNNEKLMGKTQFIKMDAFNLGFKDNTFSICFSQGFFEHFNNSDLNLLIEEQLRVAESVIFSIPSFQYPKKNKGDERLFSINNLTEILDKYNFHGFYYGFNLDTELGFLGNFKLNKLKTILSKNRQAQICGIVKRK